MPKVLVLITLAETGGAQTYVAGLLPALVGPHDVVVAAHGDGPLRAAALASGARFVPLHNVRRDLHPVYDALGLVELVRLMRRERPDILHANSSKAGVLGRLAAAVARVPARIFTVHGWAFKAYSGVPSALYRWADRLMAPLTTAIVCVSQREREAGLAARTCRPDQTVVIPTAVDADAALAARGGGDPPRVITVGRLAAPKDPLTLVRALARLDAPFHALFVGDGPERDAVEAEARAAALLGAAPDDRAAAGDDRAATRDDGEAAPADRAAAPAGGQRAIALLGDRRDVPRLLAQADVFVLSSLSEGAPMSVLEAMAAGLPVVASAVGGVPELVEDGVTGLLVAAGDAAALAAALAHLLADPELRRRLGAAGRERVRERFDLASQQRAHLDLYARVLSMP